MTVGDLEKILSEYPDDTELVFQKASTGQGTFGVVYKELYEDCGRITNDGDRFVEDLRSAEKAGIGYWEYETLDPALCLILNDLLWT